MSHSVTSRLRENGVWVGVLFLGVGVFGGLVIKAASDYPGTESQPDATVSVTSPASVQSFGSSDDLQVYFNDLLAPKDMPECQPTTGDALADLMLGINAC